MTPSTCLLITTQNRSPLLNNSLARLSKLTLPTEILVVDDGGNDGCEQLCQTWWEAGLPIRYIYNHSPEPTICSFARNIGIKHTDCDLVITSEPELLFDTDLIAQMLHDRETRGQREIISAGLIRHEQAPGQVCNCQSYDAVVNGEKVTHVGPCRQRYHVTVNWSATWACLYEREWLMALGGWDEQFESDWGWDDVDLCTRLRIWGVGHYIDWGIEATHQWHPQRGGSQDNEARFRAKGFHRTDDVGNVGEWPGAPDLVANVGYDWGVVKPRP